MALKPPVLNLDKFELTRLFIEHLGPLPEGSKIDYNAELTYCVNPCESDIERFSLTLSVNLKPLDTANPVGCRVDAKINGYFHLPAFVDEGKRMQYLRLNGCAILYGVVRGLVAAATGPFPGGCFQMPTVNIVSLVNEIDQKEKQALEEQQTAERQSPESSERADSATISE